MKKARRLELVPPYLFAELDKRKQAAMERGVDVINLGIGDPDLPTPKPIIAELKKAVEDPETHNYAPYEGTEEFRQAVARYYQERFQVKLDWKSEVIALIGSKEGIAHIAFAFVDPGDYVLVPDPGYPVYKTASLLAGGTPYTVPLLEKNDFFPDLSAIPAEVARKATMFYINYPNNPTAAVASLEQLAGLVAFAKEYDILLCHDLAYAEVAFDGYRAPSLLEVPGAKDVCIEFNSLSKMFNMTGWRVAMAVGSPLAVEALGKIKTNVDSGVFKAIQRAGIFALTSRHRQEFLDDNNRIYQARRDKVVAGLNKLGWDLKKPQAAFYLWIPVPAGYTSVAFSSRLLDEAGIVVAPGTGYGEHGEGYVRITLTAPDHVFDSMLNRMADHGITYQPR